MATKGDGSGGPKPVDKGFFQALDGGLWADGECDVVQNDGGHKCTFTINSPQFQRTIELKEGQFYPIWDPNGLHIAQDPDYGGVMTFTNNGNTPNMLETKTFALQDYQDEFNKPGYNRYVQHRAPWYKENVQTPGVASNMSTLEKQFHEPIIRGDTNGPYYKLPQGKARLPHTEIS